MIAPVAGLLALAFVGPPIAQACPQGMVMHQRAAQPKLPDGLVSIAWSIQSGHRCEMWLSRDLEQMTVPRQCQVIVHEIFHDLGAEHSTDPHSVMYPTMGAIPGPCYPRR